MAGITTEKAICEKCGADVRNGTTFCFSCGHRLQEAKGSVSGELPSISPLVSKEILEPANESADDNDRLAKAAEKRRKSRVGLRKPKEYAWEPVEDSLYFILGSLVIVIIALSVVFVMVFWK